jgi:hypothetical protein
MTAKKPKKAIGVAADGALVFNTGTDERGRRVLSESTVRKVGYLNDGTTWRLKPELTPRKRK